jgi:hypothetical protein
VRRRAAGRRANQHHTHHWKRMTTPGAITGIMKRPMATRKNTAGSAGAGRRGQLSQALCAGGRCCHAGGGWAHARGRGGPDGLGGARGSEVLPRGRSRWTDAGPWRPWIINRRRRAGEEGWPGLLAGRAACQVAWVPIWRPAHGHAPPPGATHRQSRARRRWCASGGPSSLQGTGRGGGL